MVHEAFVVVFVITFFPSTALTWYFVAFFTFFHFIAIFLPFKFLAELIFTFAGWILADGTEVEKEYGCQYEYVKDVSGNWMVKKIDGTTKPAENPTTKPAGAVKPSGETSGKKNEPTETKMKVPAKVKISSANIQPASFLVDSSTLSKR